MQHKGIIVQVLGPIVDVMFDDGKLPEINEALTVTLDGSRRAACRRRHRALHHALAQ